MGGYWFGGVGGKVGAGEVRVLGVPPPRGFPNERFALIEIGYVNCMPKVSVLHGSYQQQIYTDHKVPPTISCQDIHQLSNSPHPPRGYFFSPFLEEDIVLPRGDRKYSTGVQRK